MVGDRRHVEVYSAFMRIVGEMEVVPPLRLTDTVNAVGEFIELRDAVAEPLSSNHPVLSRREPRTTVAKSAVLMICAREQPGEGGGARSMWREKVPQPVAINTHTFSMVADVHLEPRHSLRDHLERYRGDFLPLTNLSALWVASLGGETHALQRGFALLNPAAVLSFAER